MLQWQASMKEIKARTVSYEKKAETLQQALNIALDAQTRFQNLEAAANEKIR